MRFALGCSIAMVALSVAGGSAWAETITLPQAVELALANSPAILQSDAQSNVAAAAKAEAQAMRLPHLQVREVALRTDSPADAFGLQLMQERFSFPSFVASDPNQPTPVNNFATEFEATWPIFTGGRVMAGIGQAQRMATSAQAIDAHTRAAIALATASAYMDALLARRAVELAERAHDTTQRHVDQAQAFFDAGMIIESDLLQARVQLARMQEKLITARNGAVLAKAGLFRVMGIDQDSPDTLDATLPEATAQPTSLKEAIAAALEQRNDVHAVAAQVDAARLGVRRAKGEYLPELALVGKYSLNDDKVFGSHGDSFTLMAVARWNVWNWGQTHARVSQAKSSHVVAQQAQRSHQQQVEFEVRQAWQQLAEAKARREAASSAENQAQRALSILEARFDQGVAHVTDLLDAETMLDDARVRALNATFDVERATRTLNFAVGLPPVPEVTQ